MADPFHDLHARFRTAIADAFGYEYSAVDPILRRSDRADYQVNAALALARRLRRSPTGVAREVVAHLASEGVIERAEVSGPGFINVTLADRFIAAGLAELVDDERLGVSRPPATETVVIDFSGPNVAKEMHVGHLRSTIIGDAIARLLEFLGHAVVRQNHVGDWGTPFGMLIEHLLDLGRDEAARELSVGDLNDFYRQAREAFDSDPAFAERARRRVVALQAGDGATMSLWQRLVDESERYFRTVYERLGVTLSDDDVRGESFYNPMLADVASELRALGVAEVSDGALCAFPPGFSGRGGDPLPLIIQKQDGGFGYAATDLAALRYRVRVLGAARLIYVVGAPQQTHFALIFAVARLAGWLPEAVRAEHVTFGSVLGPDRRMYRSRSGEAVKLIDLLDEAVDRAQAVVAEKNPELDPTERSEVARMVGIGAVKYADLSTDRVRDYIFEWERMLSFDGNTAPYLQYAHARIRSIFRRAGEWPEHTDHLAGDIVLTEAAERTLVLELLSFDGVVHATAEHLEPHRLCAYLYGLASAFTAFYEGCPVLQSTGSTRHTRLLLCDITARTLALGLGLLGIEAPERM